MSILIDTNVLLRRIQPDHPSHPVAFESVAHILSGDQLGCYTPQVVAEFWNAATRPAEKNGLGLSVAMTLHKVHEIEEMLTLLEDIAAIYDDWKRLVVQHQVRGAKVHDTRLVAAMNVHGVRRILTFNTGDFARFPVEVIHPAALAG
ncbi:MAG: type II toxin-antitoxin system VapC family toxin [Acetobacteraceae bacterium]